MSKIWILTQGRVMMEYGTIKIKPYELIKKGSNSIIRRDIDVLVLICMVPDCKICGLLKLVLNIKVNLRIDERCLFV